MNCNFYQRDYDRAYTIMMKARDAAIQAVKDAGYFITDPEDGFPAWRRCFFGETRKAYEEAVANYEVIRFLYEAKEAELNAWAKRNKRNRRPPIWRKWGKRNGRPR